MSLPQCPSENFESIWEGMYAVIMDLLSQKPVSREEWNKLFHDVYDVCLWNDNKGTRKLVRGLQSVLFDYVPHIKYEINMKSRQSTLLKAYVSVWTRYFEISQYLSQPFAPIDRALNNQQMTSILSVKKKTENSYVKKLILSNWNEHIFSEMQCCLANGAILLVKSERQGVSFDPQLVIAVRQSFVNLYSEDDDNYLKSYVEDFESPYMKSLEAHYAVEATDYFFENSISEYIKYALGKLREEEARGERYLNEISLATLRKCCVDIFVAKYLSFIVIECLPLLKDYNTDDLNLMFNLVDHVDGGANEILLKTEYFILEEGKRQLLECRGIVTTDAAKYVEILLKLYKTFSALVSTAFKDDHRSLRVKDTAFQQLVNDVEIFKLDLNSKNVPAFPGVSIQSRSPELLAYYCDMLLRKTSLSKRLSSEEIEIKLKDVILILKYMSNIDVFLIYYKGHMTRRLVLDISMDNDKEGLMVEWLKEVRTQSDYINKLTTMLQDIKVSQEISQRFKKDCACDAVSKAANIKILNAGAWSRKSENLNVTLPSDLEDLMPEVEEFYKKYHNGRRLHWHHRMSSGVISFQTECGQYDLKVTAFQLSVLFCWNERPRQAISFEDLKLATQLPEAVLKKALWFLIAMPKSICQILICNPSATSPEDISSLSLFSINHQYALIKSGKVQKRGRIDLIKRLQLSNEHIREEDNEEIIQLRIFRTQEAIIRILKTRKQISHAQLQTDLVEMLKSMFYPQKRLIKQQIEWLIDHGYIKRDENDLTLFQYAA